jgi:CheY-like chemotaxis protein
MMNPANGPFTVVVAEDDDDDFLLMREALGRLETRHKLHRVNDGEELIDFLNRRADAGSSQTKERLMVFLDLNMPRKNGQEALRDIRSSEQLKKIPVVVMTTSTAEGDIRDAYEQGASSYICKPNTVKKLHTILKAFEVFWLKTAKIPKFH